MIRWGSLRYFAAVVIAREGNRGIEILCVRSQDWKEGEQGRVLTRFVGGMEEPEDRGDLIKTLRREVLEKTGLRIKEDAKVRCLGNFGTWSHSKHFFYLSASDCDGAVRQQEVIDRRRARTMFPPKWVPLVEVGDELCITHQPALRAFKKQVSRLQRAQRK